jgi:diguanylate cyclase (GGDEF)-like protein
MYADVDSSGGDTKRIEQALGQALPLFRALIEEQRASLRAVSVPADLKLDGGGRRAGARIGSRHQALQRLALECGRIQEDKSYQFSVLMVQFHGLALATNRLGDAFKHDPLARVTGVLLKGLGAHDLCCRLSSDEFLVIFPSKGKAECWDLVNCIGRRCVPELGASDVDMAVSMGLASSPAQGSTIQALFAAADLAMLEHGVAIIANVPTGEKATVGIGLLASRAVAVAEA